MVLGFPLLALAALLSPDLVVYSFPDLPAIRDGNGREVMMPVTVDGPGGSPLETPRMAPLFEGGFSALARVESGLAAPDRGFELWTITDRGPNLALDGRKDAHGQAFGPGAKFFPQPTYQQAILKLRLDPDRSIHIAERITLKRGGRPVSGLPSSAIGRPSSESAYSSLAEKSERTAIPPSPLGYDFEGLIEDRDPASGEGRFWTCEEYGPSIQVFDAAGNLRREFIPGAGVSGAGTMESPAVHPLPAVLLHRKGNRGFEGLAGSREHVFALLQSPLDPSGGASGEPGHGNKETRLHRLLRLSKRTLRAEMFAYEHHPDPAAMGAARAEVRTGDLAALDEEGREFLVIEYSPDSYTHLIRITLDPTATPLSLEEGARYEEGKVPWTPVERRLERDLTRDLRALPVPGKPEGIALGPKGAVFLAFDNDYGFASDLVEVFALPGAHLRRLVLQLTLER